MTRFARICLATWILGSTDPLAQEQKLVFKNESATIRIGWDDKVYVSSGTLFLRCNRDGTDPVGAPPVAILSNATAGPTGITAAAYAHFARNVTLFDAENNVVGRFGRIADAASRDRQGRPRWTPRP